MESCPATTPPGPSHSGYPPWILKWGGLESYGQRIISLNGKIKIIVLQQQNIRSTIEH